MSKHSRTMKASQKRSQKIAAKGAVTAGNVVSQVRLPDGSYVVMRAVKVRKSGTVFVTEVEGP